MKSICVLAFAFAVVFGVSAEPCCPRAYPVRLNNYGPSVTTVPVFNSHIQTPTVERMPLRTAGCVPVPKTIGNTCTCVKTVVKPQVHNQIVSVPSVQRIIQTTATPVIENIHYQAIPQVEPQVCSLSADFVVPNGIQCELLKPRCAPLLSVPSCTCGQNVILI